MKRRMGWTTLLASMLLLAACSTVEDQGTERLDLLDFTACRPAGDTGLTAHYVNESVSDVSIANACDVAIYFDEESASSFTVSGVTVTQPDAGGDKTFGVMNNGSNVDVADSTFVTEEVAGQHVPLLFENGAEGDVRNNHVIGNHRSAIVARGEGTSVSITRNTVVGSGLIRAGWAENGIQIDRGASADVKRNEVRDHRYDGADSAGIMVYESNGVTVQHNDVIDNDVGIALLGDGNHASRNTVEATAGGYGLWVLGGDNNRLVNNDVIGDGTAAIGLLLYGAGPMTNTKVIRNEVSGFGTDTYYASGEDSRIQANVTPTD